MLQTSISPRSPVPAACHPQGYRVHLYGVVRVAINVTDATSQVDAIQKAETTPGLSQWFQHGEYAHELVAAFVDEGGDRQFHRSESYFPDNNAPDGWTRDTDRATEYADRVQRHHDACLFISELLDSVEALSDIGREHGIGTLASLLYLVRAILTRDRIDVQLFDPSILTVISALPSARLWLHYIRLVA